MLPIQKKLININFSKGRTIKPEYIVIHETDNEDRGANALANRNYFANHVEAQASAHFIVDESNIIQCLETYQRGWHVGDNKGHSNITNSNSIGIEICVNKDGNYAQARLNAIELTKYLMKILGLGVNKVVRHYDSSGKYCPRKMLDNPSYWIGFKNALVNGASSSSLNTIPKGSRKGIVTASSLNVRSGAGVNFGAIGSVSKGQEVYIASESKGWYNIYFGNHGGWVSSDYVSASVPVAKPVQGSSNVGQVVATVLNVRAGRGTGYKAIGQLKQGQKVKLCYLLNNWWSIDYGSSVGYISADYIKRL